MCRELAVRWCVLAFSASGGVICDVNCGVW